MNYHNYKIVVSLIFVFEIFVMCRKLYLAKSSLFT